MFPFSVITLYYVLVVLLLVAITFVGLGLVFGCVFASCCLFACLVGGMMVVYLWF